MQKELENITADRDTQRSAREAAEEEARELQQAVQKKEDEIRGFKKEAKSAHASLDNISQEANRLSSACQEAADKNKGEPKLTTANSQLGAVEVSMFCVCLHCVVICGGFLTAPAAQVPITACCTLLQGCSAPLVCPLLGEEHVGRQ